MTANHTLACLGLVSLLLGTAAVADEVSIGRGGDSSTRSDTDLVVYDPFFVQSETEPGFFYNASTGDLRLGSGNGVDPGDDGDLLLENGNGATGVFMGGTGAFIILGGSANAGDLFIRDENNFNEIVMNGSTGDVTNQIAGDGLVKAWCRVNSDGTFAGGFRCNSNSAETRLIPGLTGQYEVDFTSLSTDISARPHVISCSDDSMFVSCQEVTSVLRSGDPSSLFVTTRNSDGSLVNSAFTVVIF